MRALGTLIVASTITVASSRAAQTVSYTVTAQPNGAIEVVSPDGGRATFRPEFNVLHTTANPNIEMRWGKFAQAALQLNDTGSVYNVLTWGAKAGGTIDAQHVEDGFDPTTDRGYGPGRTADFLRAGRSTVLRATKAERQGATVVWDFPADERVALRAEIVTPADGQPPALRWEATIKQDGWYSFGYVGAPSAAPADVQELWQPLIWNERRFPEGVFLEAAYRCPLPTTLVTRGGVTIGVVADPAEYPFQPMPNFQNSRFGVAVRNGNSEAQPMLYAPLLGGFGSQLKAGQRFEFTSRLVVAKAALSPTYERIARTLFGFADVRHNALGSLNATFERMLEFGLTDYAKFNSDLRGFAYDTDVPGAVKNVSALHPLGIALVTDNREIFTRLARPLMEYFVSRERFLFTTDPKVKGQSASARLGGLGAPLTEYANLYAMSAGRTPFFRTAAESLFGRDRILNLEGTIRGNNWSNALGLYRATGERRWLDHAIRDADAYLKTRVNVRQTDFSDPDSRGLFFWTAFTPQWIELFELYEETKDRRYLAAAHQGARDYAQFVWLAPRIPEGNVSVNEGGLAPAYRAGPRYPRIKLDPETVPAWRPSEMGLTSESAPTSKGARGILLACYAPWMLRISALTEDRFLHDIARSAIIGRYTSFPGYHLNTARTTAYEKPDFARRGKDELNSATSIHYNHIWPHIALVFDYLVSDTFAKSKGAVDFPSRYAEGYGYLQQKIYGDRPGNVYDQKGMFLWMPRGVIEVSHPELNYVVARGEDSLAIVLTNQSRESVRATVRVNGEIVGLPAGGASATVWSQNRAAAPVKVGADGMSAVEVAPEGITTLILRGVKPKPGFQREMVAPTPALPSPGQYDSGFHGARAVALRFGAGDLTSAYIYLPDVERRVTKCTLQWRQGGTGFQAISDASFPFDFTVPTAGNADVEWFMELETSDGKREKSPVQRIPLGL